MGLYVHVYGCMSMCVSVRLCDYVWVYLFLDVTVSVSDCMSL